MNWYKVRFYAPVAAVLCGAALAVGLFAWMLVAVGTVEAERKAAFTAECVQDLKAYECEALWRSGNRNVVPVFFPIR